MSRPVLRRTRAAFREMQIDVGRACHVELVIQPGVQQRSGLTASHAETPFAPPSSTNRRFRARDSLDITVPIGMLSTEAISL